jgi:TRAP-type transport system periplasmic protein
VAAATGLLVVACHGDVTQVNVGAEAEGPVEAPPPEEVEGDQVTLNLGHPFPPTHHIHTGVMEGWAEEVNEATGGTVDVRFHVGAALAAPDATYEIASLGAMELGWALHGYTPGRFPLTDVVELPFLFEDAEQATEVLWELYEDYPELQEEYGDVKVLALFTHDIGNLYTVDQPVESPDDLSGLSLRAPGPIQTRLIESLGASGVGLPAPELYDSLERGVIDGTMIADTGVASFTLHEVVRHGLHANFYVAGEFLVMNQETWDRLSPSQQQAIDAISGRELSMEAARLYDEFNAEVLESYEEWDMDVVPIEDVDVEEWREIALPVHERWIEQREAAGQPGQELYDRVLELTGREE